MSVSFLDRTSPTIIQETTKYSSAPRINFTDKFQLSIRMTIGNHTLFSDLDKIQIEFTLNYVYKSNYRNITTTKMKLSQCKPEKFPNHLTYFTQYMLNESLCPDIKDEFIEGDFLSDEMFFFQVKFHMCENATGIAYSEGEITCKSEQEIKDFLSKNLVKAHLFYTNTFYNDKNYSDPEINYIDNYNLNIYQGSQRETHFYLENSFLYSDDSYFFLLPFSRLFSNIAFSFFSERAAAREPQMSDFVLINIRASKSSTNITRMYRGFADLVANIGAILNIVMIIFTTSISVYSSIEYNTRILRSSVYLYHKSQNLRSNNDSKLKNIQVRQFIDESKSKININQTSRFIGSCDKEEFSLDKMNKISKKINVDLKIDQLDSSLINMSKKEITNYDNLGLLQYNHKKSFLQIIVICICPCFVKCNKKFQTDKDFFEFSQKKYSKFNDIFYFIEKFGELSLITKLLLKKEEMDMIDLIKTMIFVKNEDFVSTVKERSKTIIIPKMNVAEHLKMKVSLIEHEEKLKNIMNKISLKEEKSVFEDNFIQFFENRHLNEM